MPLKISQHDIMRMKQQVENMKKRTANISQKSHELVGTIVRTAEVGAAAFSMGLVQGKYGGVEVVGVPMDLGLGLGLHMMGLLGVGGDMSHHLHAFGDGSLAAYLTTLGRGTGLSWKRKELTGAPTEFVRKGSDQAEEQFHRDARGWLYVDSAGNPIRLSEPIPSGAKTIKPQVYVKGERLTDEDLERLARG